MADDTKNLKNTVTDTKNEEEEIITEEEMNELEHGTGLETGRTKQQLNRLAELRDEIKHDKAALKEKEKKEQELARAIKNNKARTHALCGIAGELIRISEIEWTVLKEKNAIEKWLLKIKTEAAEEAVKKHIETHPVPDLAKIRAEAIEMYKEKLRQQQQQQPAAPRSVPANAATIGVGRAARSVMVAGQ